MDDLIRRSDAIKAVLGLTMYQERVPIDSVIVNINKAPTIEPKRGEWIDRSDGGRILNPWWENYECNRCGYYGSGTWNFCPNCGARMKGADDE